MARQQLGLALVADRRDVLAGSRPRAPHRSSGASSGRPRTARGRRPGRRASPVSRRATLEEKLVRTTRWGWAAISSVRLSRTSASEPEVPGDSTLVLSHRIASTPSLPSASSAVDVGARADQGRRIELPVAGVQHACRSRCRAPARWRRGSSG